MKSWTVLLAIVAFSLSLLGTFLVRSGVLTSVHAFATDPARGVLILLLLTVAVGGSLALYAWRAPRLGADGFFAPVSREGALALNNLFLAAACVTVLVGTLYPLLLDAVGGGAVSVGPPYYEATFAPLMALLLLALAAGPLMSWRRADLKGALSRLKFAGALAVAAWALAWWRTSGDSPLPVLGIGLAVWVAAGVSIELAGRVQLFRVAPAQSWRRARTLPRAAWAMSLAHVGVAVFVAGVTASSAWRTEAIGAMRPGDSRDLAGYAVVFDGAGFVQGPNYEAERGTFRVLDGDREVATLEPEKRRYFARAVETTEAAIHTTFMADLYAVLGDRTEDGAWTVRLYHNPLVPWIWGGCLTMALGGLVGLSDRRLRLALPARREAAVDAASRTA